jgi:hypothetical protein
MDYLFSLAFYIPFSGTLRFDLFMAAAAPPFSTGEGVNFETSKTANLWQLL